MPYAGQIAGTIAALGAGFLDNRQRNKMLASQREDLAGAEVDYDKSMAALAKQQYGTTQKQRDIAQIMQRPTDLSPLQAKQAQLLDVAGQSGDRALMAMVPQADVTGQILAAQRQDVQNELAGKSYLAGAEKQAIDQNIGLRRQEGMMAQQLAGQNLMSAGQNLAETEASNPFADALGNVASIWASAPTPTGKNLMSAGQNLAETEASNPFADALGNVASIWASAPTPTPTGKNGGVIDRILAEGGKPIVQKLEGPEDHDKKKYAIMEDGAVLDEDNGEKVAEATGQEYILNSDQAGTIHSEYDMIAQKIKNGEEVSQDEWMKFYGAVDEVFSQPQFNETA